MAKEISLLLLCIFLFCGSAMAADRVEKLDTDGDGKIDAWIYYDSAGEKSVVAGDKHKDQKPDFWQFFKKHKIYKREWDRNFDGKSDFRVIEEDGHVIEKQYDDNFDGVFERIVKMPRKGESGNAVTTAKNSL